MNAKNDLYSPCIPLLTAILILSLAGLLRVVQAAPFTPPDLEGFNLHDERDADGDGDGDGKNETRIRQYLNSNGDNIISFTSNERL